MRTFIVVAAMSLGVSSTAIGQYAYLTIQHPQQTWRYGQGTIEEATLCANQKGIYTQNDLYLTFSARDLSFLSTDSVEIQLTFTLPDNAIVIDSWLLIDDPWFSPRSWTVGPHQPSTRALSEGGEIRPFCIRIIRTTINFASIRSRVQAAAE